MKKSIKRKTACMAAVFLAILAGMTVLFFIKMDSSSESLEYREQVLVLNEIEKRTEIEGESPAKEQIANMQEKLRRMEGAGLKREEVKTVLGMGGICGIFIILIFIYIYNRILRPFEELEAYASEIAKGNLEVELPYHRTNLFGAFTWAFDHMRREIIKARACEQEAIENNKTVIATLSHDIKTPIASIRAYAEGLEANMDHSPERRNRYVSVIMRKCDEVTKLTNDLFLHSISDLEKLQMNMESVELGSFLSEVLEGLNQQIGDSSSKKAGSKIGESGRTEGSKIEENDRTEGREEQMDIVKVVGELPKFIVKADRKRLEQVLENVITNARKYAPGTGISLWVEVDEQEEADEPEEEMCRIHIKDGGKGILPEDMPFVLEKFYRGKNTKDQPGAGLGLYIVDYIMKQMGGKVELKNSSNGLEVVLFLKTS